MKEKKKKNTLEVSLCPKKCYRQSEDGEPVQLREDVLLEGQERGQVVELSIEALPVAFGRVAFGLASPGVLLGSWTEAAGESEEKKDVRTTLLREKKSQEEG